MNATIAGLVNQLSDQIKQYRTRIPKQTGAAVSAAQKNCSLILGDLRYIKPRALIRALYLDDTPIHNTTIEILAEILRLPDGLARTMLIRLLMEVPAELYHPHLAVRLGRTPPGHLLALPSGSSPAQPYTVFQRVRSMAAARQFLRGLLIPNPSESQSE